MILCVCRNITEGEALKMGDFKTEMQCGKCEQEYERLKMEDKLDFKAAQKLMEWHPSKWGDEAWKENKPLFRTALRLASRLQSHKDIRPALDALMDYKQADEGGIMVLVSRQAIHEVSDYAKAMATQMIAEEVGE